MMRKKSMKRIAPYGNRGSEHQRGTLLHWPFSLHVSYYSRIISNTTSYTSSTLGFDQ